MFHGNSISVSQCPPPSPTCRCTSRNKRKISSLASPLLLSPFTQLSRWERNGGWIKTARTMTSEVKRNHRPKKQQKKNTHIHQDKESRRDDWWKLHYEGEKKAGSGWTRLQTEEFQSTTRDRLSSPNWFCHVAVGARLSKDSVVRVKGKPPTRLFSARTWSNARPSWLDRTPHACSFHIPFAVTSRRGLYSSQQSERVTRFVSNTVTREA